ncbi:MAG: pilus assembly protein PilP [Pseudomonadota bacterium]
MRTAIVFCVLLLAGCGQDEFADLKTFMAQAGQGGQHALEPMPALKPTTEFSYDPADLPDPFKPRSMKAKSGSGGLQPDMSRPKEFLETFPLDALRMVGTLRKGGVLYALVKTPDNALYRVRVGNYLGQNFGRIVGVTETAIELKEMTQDGAGDWAESKASLALQE